jgi:hypothetical protein
VPLKASQDFVLFSLKWATCHLAVTEAAHKVTVDNQQVWMDYAKTLQQENAILKSPARTVQPPTRTAQPPARIAQPPARIAQPPARTAQPPARTVQPAVPKKSASEKFARNLGIANSMISLITGIENLEQNQNNQNNQNYQNN